MVVVAIPTLLCLSLLPRMEGVIVDLIVDDNDVLPILKAVAVVTSRVMTQMMEIIDVIL